MTPALSYVDYGSRVSAPPPVVCAQGHFLGLLLDGSEDKIKALLERVLNDPARLLSDPAKGIVEYRPLASRVFMLAGEFAKISSQAPGFENWGSVSETQLSIWVPLAAGKDEGGDFVADHICIWLPYIFVDNPLSYAGGREDYGYPKAMGSFSPSNGLGDPLVLKVFGGDFGPGRQAGWVTLLELSRTQSPAAGAGSGMPAPAPNASPGPDWLAGEELVSRLVQSTGGDAQALTFGFTLDDILKKILTKIVRQVSLKQVRGAGSADEACYQAIIEMQVQGVDVKGQITTDQWNVSIEKLQSHPIEEDLGITSMPASLALNLSLGMTLEPGEVVAP